MVAGYPLLPNYSKRRFVFAGTVVYNASFVMNEQQRCPICDSVVAGGDAVCRMCGTDLNQTQPITVPTVETIPTENPSAEELPPTPEPATPSADPIFYATLQESKSQAVVWLTAVFTIITLILGGIVLWYQPDQLTLALAPTETPIPPTATVTPTFTPTSTETPVPTLTPSLTPTPIDTPTLQPERLHNLASGETLIGLAVRYRVSPESIAEVNGFTIESPIQEGQTLVIPWPTPTPPLQAVAVDVNGETVVADPANCERYEIQSGDSISVVSSRYGIDLPLLLAVNRLAEGDILQPGDTVCIPEISYGELPPTPGPSPTPAPTRFPAGPELLYPINDTVVTEDSAVIRLQWTAVKTLAPDEQYMVELVNADNRDALAWRGFTRDNGFVVPYTWRPQEPESFTMQWRVAIVKVTGTRPDGLPLYTYGGRFSDPATFVWLGAIPTPTITPSPTPSITPTPSP